MKSQSKNCLCCFLVGIVYDMHVEITNQNPKWVRKLNWKHWILQYTKVARIWKYFVFGFCLKMSWTHTHTCVRETIERGNRNIAT